MAAQQPLELVSGGSGGAPGGRVPGLDGAAKDAGLIAAAMRASGTDASLMEAVGGQYRKASAAGYGEQDMAAVFRAFRPEDPQEP